MGRPISWGDAPRLKMTERHWRQTPKMKTKRSAAGLLGLAMLLWTASGSFAQWQPEVRRARPVDEPPVPRALPADESIDRALRSLKEESSEPSQHAGEGAGQRQLDYANGLFTSKLYDLAAAE